MRIPLHWKLGRTDQGAWDLAEIRPDRLWYLGMAHQLCECSGPS